MASKIPILLYHDLESPDCPNEKSNPATKGTVVYAKNFEAQIKCLAEKGYETISIKDYFDIVSRKKPIPPRKIIITFDDGHYSNYYLAFPVLKKYGFKATFLSLRTE
jgi:peptidoglycan/xylan/chitin deacetylase (PgdA/CDA1 family)